MKSTKEQYKLAWQYARIAAKRHIIENDSFGYYDNAEFPLINPVELDPRILGIAIQHLSMRETIEWRDKMRSMPFWERMIDSFKVPSAKLSATAQRLGIKGLTVWGCWDDYFAARKDMDYTYHAR